MAADADTPMPLIDGDPGTVVASGAISLAIVGRRETSVETVAAEIARWTDLDVQTPGEVVSELVRRKAATPPPTIVLDGLDETRNPAGIASSLLRPLAREGAANLLVGVRSTEYEDSPTELLRGVACQSTSTGSSRTPGISRCMSNEFCVSPARGATATIGVAQPRCSARRRARRAILPGRPVGLPFALRAGRPTGRHARDVPRRRRGGDARRHQRDRGAICRDRGGHRIDDDANARSSDRTGIREGRRTSVGRGGVAAIATALSRRDYAPKDVRWLLDSRARSLLQVMEIDGREEVRLFHAALAAHLAPKDRGDAEVRIVRRLTRLAIEVPRDDVDPYIEAHLSSHVAASGARLERGGPSERTRAAGYPNAVAVDATKAASVGSLPHEIAAVVATRHLLPSSTRGDRDGLRQLGLARSIGEHRFVRGTDGGAWCTAERASDVIRRIRCWR